MRLAMINLIANGILMNLPHFLDAMLMMTIIIMMNCILQDYRMREMFKPSMAELGLVMYQLEMCVQVR